MRRGKLLSPPLPLLHLLLLHLPLPPRLLRLLPQHLHQLLQLLHLQHLPQAVLQDLAHLAPNHLLWKIEQKLMGRKTFQMLQKMQTEALIDVGPYA
jgi:hypothetical protein